MLGVGVGGHEYREGERRGRRGRREGVRRRGREKGERKGEGERWGERGRERLTLHPVSEWSSLNRHSLYVKRFLTWLRAILQQSPLQSLHRNTQSCRGRRGQRKTTPTRHTPILTIENVGGREGFLFLAQDLEVQEGTVTNFVIVVHQAAIQQHQDARQEFFARGAKLGQGGDGSWRRGGVIFGCGYLKVRLSPARISGISRSTRL